MKPNLARYNVFPSVVLADCESEITVRSFDKNFGFFDDITYEVQFVPQDISDVPIDDEMTLLGYNKSRKTVFAMLLRLLEAREALQEIICRWQSITTFGRRGAIFR